MYSYLFGGRRVASSVNIGIAVAVRFLLLFACVGGASISRADVPSSQPKSSDAPVVFDDKNLIVDAPPDPWLRPRVRKFVPGACIEFVRSQPNEMTYSVMAAVPPADPAMTTGKLAGVWLSRLTNDASAFTVLEKSPQTINGTAGVRLTVEATLHGRDTCIVYWCTSQPGGSYETLALGLQADETILRQDADRLNALLHIKDLSLLARAAPVSTAPANFESADFNYAVHLGGDWRVASEKDREQAIPGCDFCALHGARTCCAVIPIYLTGEDPDDTQLARALVRRVSFELERATDIKPLKLSDGTGFSMSFTRSVNNVDHTYRALTIKSGGFGYLVVAWTSDPSQIPLLPDALAGFQARPQPSPTFDAFKRSLAERTAEAMVLNDLGLISSSQQQYHKAVSYFEKALILHSDAIILENLLIAHTSAKTLREGLSLVRRNSGLVSQRPTLEARAAVIEAEFGDPNKSAALFQHLFSRKFESEEAIRTYALVLDRLKRADDAIAAVHAYRGYADTFHVAELEAQLYSERGDYEKAISIIQERVPAGGRFDPMVAADIAWFQLQARQYDNAAKTAQALLDSGRTDIGAYLMLGEAQFGLKHYRDAKATFELAAKKDPGSRAAQDWLRNTSGMLGEGENSSIKTPIEAVAIPSDLIHPPAPAADFGKDTNAIYLSRVTAIAFTPGVEQRTTEYRAVKVLNTAGAESLSEFTFPFEPLQEQIYLNKLEVHDADGRLVASGSVNDCWAVDRPYEQSASFSKMLNVPVPGLKPGYTVELTVTRRELADAQHLRFKEQLLSMPFPIGRSALLLRGKLDAVKVVAINGVAQRDIDGARCWSIDQPPVIRFEPHSDELDTYMPIVYLGDAAASWRDEAGSYLDMIADVLHPDPDATSLAADLTRGAASDDEKIAAILKHMQSAYSYKAIEFGRRARIPNKASLVIHNRYGDCKDHALLLHHLLNAAGFPANLVLVRSGGQLQPDLASLDQFDHLIVNVPGKGAGNSDRWFDCTDKATDLTCGVPYALAEKQVLVLDPANPHLATIPPYKPDSSTVTISRDAKLTDSGDLSVRETISGGGYYASVMREEFQRLEPKSRTEAAQAMLSGRSGSDLVLQDVKFSNLDETDRPFVMDVSYDVHRRFSSAGDRLVGALPAPMERSWLSPEHVANRESPFRFRFPVVYKTTTTLALPAGYRCDGLPAPRQFSNGFASGDVAVAPVADGGAVREEVTVHFPAGRFPAAEYPDYERSEEDVIAAMEQNLILQRK